MDSKEYKVELSQRAANDIYYYIVFKLRNPSAAEKLSSHIFDEVEKLTFSPKRYKVIDIPGLKTDHRRLPIKNYFAYFLVDDDKDEVTITTIQHNKRNVLFLGIGKN